MQAFRGVHVGEGGVRVVKSLKDVLDVELHNMSNKMELPLPLMPFNPPPQSWMVREITFLVRTSPASAPLTLDDLASSGPTGLYVFL